VKATLNGVTTAYVGNYYEQTGSVTTTYYYAGGTRIAMRQGSIVNYLLGDHLGSTAITANSSGGFSSELRYKPWGETRYTNGTTPTRHQFTGQITDTEIGLYFYGARYYSNVLGRFLSADTLVPNSSDPQQLNRYAYALNSPGKYTDPTGHYIFEDGVDDDPTAATLPASRCGICTAQNAFLSPATAQRDYGVNVAMRLSQETWASDVGIPLETRLNSLFDDVENLSYSGIGTQGGFCGGADAIVGGELCITGQVMTNYRTGQIGFFVAGSLVPRIGIPHIWSGSANGGIVVAPGVSDLNNLTKLSAIQGFDAGANAVSGLGMYGQRTESLNEQEQPVVDIVTGMPVTTLAVGSQASVNLLPTGIDGSVKAGFSHTYGCVLSFSSLSIDCTGF
jgi:RHS repeat-associated protein